MNDDVLQTNEIHLERNSFRRGGLLYLILAIIILILMGWLRTNQPESQAATPMVPTLDSPPGTIPGGQYLLSGTGEPDSRVEIVIDGVTVGQVPVSGSGHWLYPVNFDAGTYEVRVHRVTAVGEQLESASTALFQVSQRYDLPTLRLPDTLDPQNFILSGEGTPDSTIEIFHNGVMVGSALVQDDGTWAFTTEIDTYQNEFYAIGFTPNREEIGKTAVLPLLLPAAAIPFTINEPELGTFNLSRNLLSIGTLFLSGDGEPDSQIELTIGDQFLGDATVNVDGFWTFGKAIELAPGIYQVNGTMVGLDGTLLGEDSVDNLVIPVVGSLVVSDAGTNGAGSLTLTGTTAPGLEVTIWVDGEEAATVTADESGIWMWESTTPLSAGEYVVQAQLTGVPDIVSETQTINLTPFVMMNDADIELLADDSGDVTLTGQSLPGNRIELFVNGNFVGEATADEEGSWRFDINLAPGAYTLTARAVGPDGSRLAESAIRTVIGEALGGLELVYGGTGQSDLASNTSTTVMLAGNTAVEFILDASWSMVEPIDNTTRFALAQEALSNLAGTILPEGTPTALRIFGNIEGNLACRTDLMIPYGPLDREAFSAVVAEAEPQFNANTAIGASLLAVINDLAEAEEAERTIVLLTDGRETCDGDPAAAIAQLVDAGFNVQVNIVGLAIAEQSLKDEFSRWAAVGGGQYFDVDNPGQLIGAMREASGAFYTVRNAAGTTVAASRVGGPPLDLDPGTYTVEIRTSPATILENVTILDGDVTQIVLR